MFEHVLDDDEEVQRDEETARLHPESSSKVTKRCYQSLCRSAAVAAMACLFGILLGTSFVHRPSSEPVYEQHHQYVKQREHQYVSEYDIVHTHSVPCASWQSPQSICTSTPMDFETAMRQTGITDEEYAACNSSIYRDPGRKVCAKADRVCYKKKPKRVDVNGTTVPIYSKEGATEVTCPSGCEGNCESDDHWYWSSICRDGGKIICYTTIPCGEEVSQWTATAIQMRGDNNFDLQWQWTGLNAGWEGGLHPANITWHNPILTQPYQGKFCLQKAALKALSRNGWELADPYEAFTAENWTVIRRSPL